MTNYLRNIIKNPELRNKILFVIGILIFVRFLASIPLPQVDRMALEAFLAQGQNQVFGVIGLFTGGSLQRLSIDLLGVGPYITAAIIVQLLTKAIPAWDAISRESERGKERLNQYSRYLSVPLAVIQAYGMIALLRTQGIFLDLTTQDLIFILMITTATSVFVMWLGELISEKGIGNGISLIIALSIIVGLPTQFGNIIQIFDADDIMRIVIFIAIALITTFTIVFVNEGERKLPVTYARRGTGPNGTVASFLPFKVNTAGVIPIIFALSFLTFPEIVARFLATADSPQIASFGETITNLTQDRLFYGIAQALLVFGFTFFYTFIMFQPEQIAENLQKQGGFIPGVRPGKETISYVRFVLLRLTTAGSVFLAFIASLPIIMEAGLDTTGLVIYGTSILIVVSVVLETQRHLNAQMAMRQYDTI